MKIIWLLPRRQRSAVREIARQAFIEAGGHRDKAILMASSRVRQAAGSVITSILVSIAVRLAVELIKYWWDNRVNVPTIAYWPDEPGS